jgi:hypothetical protein
MLNFFNGALHFLAENSLIVIPDKGNFVIKPQDGIDLSEIEIISNLKNNDFICKNSRDVIKTAKKMGYISI